MKVLSILLLLALITHISSALDDEAPWKEASASPAEQVEGGVTTKIHWFRTNDARMGMAVKQTQLDDKIEVEVYDVDEQVFSGNILDVAIRGNSRITVKELTPSPPLLHGSLRLKYYVVSDAQTGVLFIVPIDKKTHRFENDLDAALINEMQRYYDLDVKKKKAKPIPAH